MSDVSTDHDPKRKLNRRERIALRLVLLAIWLIAPWRWDHQARQYFDDIKNELFRAQDD